MFFRMVYKSGQIFLPFCHNTRVWQTDGRTDRQMTDDTLFSSQYRVCITCSAVKRHYPRQPNAIINVCFYAKHHIAVWVKLHIAQLLDIYESMIK